MVSLECPACRTPLVLAIAPPWREGGAWPPPAVPLTRRESEALRLLAAGLRGRYLARRLGVSIHTARAHTKALLASSGSTARRSS